MKLERVPHLSHWILSHILKNILARRGFTGLIGKIKSNLKQNHVVRPPKNQAPDATSAEGSSLCSSITKPQNQTKPRSFSAVGTRLFGFSPCEIGWGAYWIVSKKTVIFVVVEVTSSLTTKKNVILLRSLCGHYFMVKSLAN